MTEGPGYYEGDVPRDPFKRHAIFKRFIFDYGGGSPFDFGLDEDLAKFETVQFKAFGAEHPIDLVTTSQKWRSFLVEECGQADPAPTLVADLSAQHTKLFQSALVEYKTTWDELSGEFTAPTDLWAVWASQGTGLAVKGVAFELWRAAFDQTVLDYYED